MRLFIFFIIFAVAQVSLAQSEMGGFATKEQLIGFWEMVPLANAKSINKVDPWPQPYQWFGFYDDGHVVSMQATEQERYSARELEEAFSVLKSRSPTFKFQGGFLVIEYPDIPGHMEFWGLNIFAKSELVGRNEIRKGDIIMSLAGGSDGGPVYYRLLRRVN